MQLISLVPLTRCPMPVSFTSCHRMVQGAVSTGGSPTAFPTERYRSLAVLPPNPSQLLPGYPKEASSTQPFSLSTLMMLQTFYLTACTQPHTLTTRPFSPLCHLRLNVKIPIGRQQPGTLGCNVEDPIRAFKIAGNGNLSRSQKRLGHPSSQLQWPRCRRGRHPEALGSHLRPTPKLQSSSTLYCC